MLQWQNLYWGFGTPSPKLLVFLESDTAMGYLPSFLLLASSQQFQYSSHQTVQPAGGNSDHCDLLILNHGRDVSKYMKNIHGTNDWCRVVPFSFVVRYSKKYGHHNYYGQSNNIYSNYWQEIRFNWSFSQKYMIGPWWPDVPWAGFDWLYYSTVIFIQYCLFLVLLPLIVPW